MLNVKEYLDEMSDSDKKKLSKDQKEALSELVRLQEKYEGVSLVKADMMQLGKFGDNAFDFNQRKRMNSEKKKLTVELEYVVKMNMQWFNCGRLYVVDDRATEELQKQMKQHSENLVEKTKVENLAGQVIKDLSKQQLKGNK